MPDEAAVTLEFATQELSGEPPPEEQLREQALREGTLGKEELP